MKFVCTQENLKRGLNLVSHVSGRNQNLPILNNVLLEVKGNTITLSTTNLEIGVKTTVRGKVEEEGTLTVPAKLFNDYMASLNADKVEVKQNGHNLEIKSMNSETVIKGIEAAEFPLIPEVEKKYMVTVTSLDLRKSLQMVLFATALDNARPEISGVLFDFKDKELVLAATDSYRLAEKKLSVTASDGQPEKIIIPLFALQEISRILNENETEKEVNIILNQNQVLFNVGNTRLTSRLNEGDYPDYGQVIPQELKTTATAKTQDMLRAVKAASLFCRQGINDIHFSLSGKGMELQALNDQVGESKTAVNAQVTGGDNEIVFNYHYVIDGLSNIGSEEVVFGINSPTLPGSFKPQDAKDYVYIIMPIKQ